MTKRRVTDAPADWDAPPRPAASPHTAPVLAVDGFEGPLDWLLELARAQRIDLARLSIAALVDAFALALANSTSLAEVGKAPLTLIRWSDWLVLAADLALLRSRLLLPGDPAEEHEAVSTAEALRTRLLARTATAAAADWLERRPRLGRDAFARGGAGAATGRGRTTDLTALLRACLVALLVPDGMAAAFRVRLPFWSAAEALARTAASLPEPGAPSVPLERFLPPVAAGPGHRLRCRAAVASTFAAALELARRGAATVEQDGAWMPISLGKGTADTSPASHR